MTTTESVPASPRSTAIAMRLRDARALHAKGALDGAERIYRDILATEAGEVEALHDLGVICAQSRREQEAFNLIGRALALKPDYAVAHNSLGILLRRLGRIEEAIACYRQAIAYNARFAEAHYNIGIALKDLGRIEEAAAAYREAIRLKPDYAVAHWNLSLALLLSGRFEEGLAEYEWRSHPAVLGAHGFAGPQWNRKSPPGTPVIVHAEQGLGDTIQFVRYVRMLAARGHPMTLVVPSPLRRLLGGFDGVEVVTALKPGGYSGAHCPMMSLPLGFGTDLGTIPANVPYLKAAPDAVARFKARLSGPGLKLGLVWRSNPKKADDAQRSVDPASLAPLMRLPGVRVMSLQKEPGPGDLDALRRHGTIEDWTDELGDFADTAALIEVLDLVVSVDTAVAHLAGALARPVFILLPFVPDWRWLLEREDSPWYPTARLFRQTVSGRWDDVVSRAAAAIDSLVRDGSRP